MLVLGPRKQAGRKDSASLGMMRCQHRNLQMATQRAAATRRQFDDKANGGRSVQVIRAVMCV
jgi:hypothetical protein